jgi:hypothetical protein
MKYISSILLAILLVVATSGIAPGIAYTGVAQAYCGIPTFSIVSVVRDNSVTIRTNNFPAHDTFNVLMNYMGTRGINGVKVDSINSGSGGSFTATFNIPTKMKGEYQVAIRLQSTSGSGYYAYNWFYNNTAKAGYGSCPCKYGSNYGWKNTWIQVTKVKEDTSVTFALYNLPKKDAFKILIYKIGTKATNGVKVGEFSTGSGGYRTFKVDIPASLKNKATLGIRVQNLTGSGYYYDTWFYNSTYP